MLRMAGIRSARIVPTLILSLGLALLTGCAAMGGGGSSGVSSSGVTVTPVTANVRAGDAQQIQRPGFHYGPDRDLGGEWNHRRQCNRRQDHGECHSEWTTPGRCPRHRHTLVTQFPQNSCFASPLQQVAQIIPVRAALGLQRQICFVSMGGFDTHTGHLAQQDSLFNDLNASLSAFYQATVEMGVASNVTTFTLPDFGRTWLPHSTGTDHAWGSHHIVMGGAVKGGDF